MKKASIYKIILTAAALLPAVAACGIYSFSGTSIQPDVKTVEIDYFEYKALKVNPNLSNSATEALKEKFRKLPRLEQVDEDGDLKLHCEITGYDVAATAITANETAAQNRLTVTIKCDFENVKYPEDNLSKSFSAYADFDATELLDSVQDSLCEEILEKIIEDIFNATVAQW